MSCSAFSFVVLAFFSRFLNGTTISWGMPEKSGGGVRYESVVEEAVKPPNPPACGAFDLLGNMARSREAVGRRAEGSTPRISVTNRRTALFCVSFSFQVPSFLFFCPALSLSSDRAGHREGVHATKKQKKKKKNYLSHLHQLLWYAILYTRTARPDGEPCTQGWHWESSSPFFNAVRRD